MAFRVRVLKIKVDLRTLILLLCVVTLTFTIANTFQSVYQVQRDLMMRNTLEANRVYAQKTAETADAFLRHAMLQLKYSASYVSSIVDEAGKVDREIERLFQQSDSFNSTYFVSAQAQILSISSNQSKLKYHTLSSEGATAPIAKQQPMITEPLVSPVGNYMINITYPVFSPAGDYLGYVGGSIYLNQDSILSELLGKHNYRSGSYLYVVDRSKTLIYHPLPERIGEVITNNLAINAVTSSESGDLDIVNSKGVAMLAGFYPVSEARWGVVAQTSKQSVLEELESQMWQVVAKSAPLGVVTLIFIWFAASYISKPLSKLANAVEHYDSRSPKAAEALDKIQPWYFEAHQLKLRLSDTFSAVSRTVQKLNSESLTDPMTGMSNRRGLTQAINDFYQKQVPFTVLALDIDHFKQVNDQYGHTQGDALLREVAELIKREVRLQDMTCRSGGEEFIVFLSGVDVERARVIAERIRLAVESHSFAGLGQVTISIGIAHWQSQEAAVGKTIKDADDALYRAKRNGRNRTEVFR